MIDSSGIYRIYVWHIRSHGGDLNLPLLSDNVSDKIINLSQFSKLSFSSEISLLCTIYLRERIPKYNERNCARYLHAEILLLILRSRTGGLGL